LTFPLCDELVDGIYERFERPASRAYKLRLPQQEFVFRDQAVFVHIYLGEKFPHSLVIVSATKFYISFTNTLQEQTQLALGIHKFRPRDLTRRICIIMVEDTKQSIL
jgi:hypothetical protein